MPQNHVIDPTYFLDAIEEFAFDYDWYPILKTEMDEMKRIVTRFDHKIIHGSLQPQASSIEFRQSGNTQTLKYKFYCSSLYRIREGDFIHYEHRYLHVDEFQDYDQWGVREVTLTSVNLTNYRDFQEYLQYLEGEKTI